MAEGLSIDRLFGIKQAQVVEGLKPLINRGALPIVKTLASEELLSAPKMIDSYADQVVAKVAPEFALPQAVVGEALRKLLAPERGAARRRGRWLGTQDQRRKVASK